jgi:hypothetical protein
MIFDIFESTQQVHSLVERTLWWVFRQVNSNFNISYHLLNTLDARFMEGPRIYPRIELILLLYFADVETKA